MSKFHEKISADSRPSGPELTKLLTDLVKGLTYISETDCAIEPISGEKGVTAFSIEDVLGSHIDESSIEEIDFRDFFEKLTRARDWHGHEEIERRHRFEQLREALVQNLKDIRVYRVGRITIDIYVVGIDRDGRLAGIKTKAVET